MLDKRIKLEDVYENTEYETMTYYFFVPKELVPALDKEKEAVSATISVEVPASHIEATDASVMYSPTDENGGDYDWRDIDLPYEKIEELIALAISNPTPSSPTQKWAFFKNGALDDDEIVMALAQATNDYEDGAIIEARDLLSEIIAAIDEFCSQE